MVEHQPDKNIGPSRIEELDAEASLDELPMQQQVLDYTNGDMYEVPPRFKCTHSLCTAVVLKYVNARRPAPQGNTLGSMRHGWGKHTCANGDKYTGNWRLDKRHGRGHAVFARGVHYEGEWADDLADGCVIERSAWHTAAQSVNCVQYESSGLYLLANERAW